MNAKKRSTKKLTIKESYSDIWSDNAWDAYDIALEYLGAEGLCEALAKAMGTDALADNLKYIFRMYEIPFDEDDEEYDEDEDFDESVKRSMKEAIDLDNGYEQVHSPDSDYFVYRKTIRDDNGKLVKGVWAAQAVDKKTFKPTGEPFEITYDQARGIDPIVGTNLGKIVGKALKMGDMRRESCGSRFNKRKGKKSVTERFHRVDMQDKIRNMERDFGEIKRIVNRNVSGYADDLYDDFNNAEHALGVLDSKLVEKYDPDRY